MSSGKNAIAICTLLCLGRLGSQATVQPSPDEHMYDVPGHEIRAELLDNPELYDADLVDATDSLWLTWLEYIPGQGDYLWIGRRTGDEWSIKSRLTHGTGLQLANPTVTVDARSRLRLTYEKASESKWGIFMADHLEKDFFTPPVRLTPEGRQDINHKVVPMADGSLWILWQGENPGGFGIFARHVEDGKLGPIEEVSPSSPHVHWHPSAVVSRDGRVWVAWDAFDGQSYNVWARARGPEGWAEAVPVADSPAFEGKADLAAGSDGRVWVVWESDALNWGGPFNNRQLPMTESYGSLHRYRMLHMALLDSDGVHRLADPPMPLFKEAAGRPDAPRGSEKMGCYYERGKLLVDQSGRLWLVYRHFYEPRFLGERRFNEDNMGLMYAVYARCFTADRWSELFRFDLKQGDGDQRLEITPHGTGIAVAWTVGRTHRNFRPLKIVPNDREMMIPRGVALATIAGRGPATGKLPAARAAGRVEGSMQPRPRMEPGPRTSVAGVEYELVYGDLHRHTDLSRCYPLADGSLTDAYRYALGPGHLDFMAITDHAADLNWGNAASQVWWRSCKEVDRHLLEPLFMPFYSFEHSRNFGARGIRETDHNVVSLRPDMLRPEYVPYPELTKELGDHSFLIPHAPINTDNVWDYQPEQRHRPLLEIYQGFRDEETSQTEQAADQGLRRGHRFGFIASSDHLSTSASYGCAWTRKRTRAAVFEALQKRRTFGATARIELSVLAGSQWMGESMTVAQMPEMLIHARGTAAFEKLEIILDGKVRESLPQNSRDISVRYRIGSLPAGNHFVYVRLTQQDGNRAWASPFFLQITGKPPTNRLRP
ncbi:MAG: DUF3604 domain-containing protein [Acidobacteria bacterium]|nr:DUF3604 domain-containing protein [Acidobacteriota bacterium]